MIDYGPFTLHSFSRPKYRKPYRTGWFWVRIVALGMVSGTIAFVLHLTGWLT